jgi:hypothetical protein
LRVIGELPDENPPDTGPALGMPMPANPDGDPLSEQMALLLRSGAARSIRRGAGAISFAYDNGGDHRTYVVDAESYRPLRLTSTSPGGARLTARFVT